MKFFDVKNYYQNLEEKYISNLDLDGRKIDVNWVSKIGIFRGLKSLMHSEGLCGTLPQLHYTFPVRSPRLVRYRVSKHNWHGITFFIDDYMSVESVRSLKSKINVAVLMEPKHLKPEVYRYADENADVFDFILTHDDEILKKYPDKSAYCIAGAACIESNSVGMHLNKKNKLISTIFSNKTLLEGHKFRHLFAREVVKEKKTNPMTNLAKADLYGTGTKNKTADYKSSTLKDYMFHVAIENGISDTYFTEKIMDCFLTGTIPIYRGTKNISKYFDPRGIIFFREMDELKSILENVNIDTYKKMIPYAKNNLEITKKYMYIDDIMLLLTLNYLDKKGFDLEDIIRYY